VVPVDVLTLIVPPLPGPSILVLQPQSDLGKKKNSRVVPIWVGAPEASQLSMALEQMRFNRPMTHDLFLDALTNLDTIIEHMLTSRLIDSYKQQAQ
jgi:bifunctional DNase/RNase